MIREAMDSDVQKIRSLMQAIPGLWHPWWSEETIASAIRSANGLAFVWEDDSQILGFVCAHDLGFRAYLSELGVAVDARKKGIGASLVRTVEEALRRRGQQIVIADVWRDAEQFYGSLGWEAPEATLLRQRLSQEG
jgi:predicted N-acetyltransferase YhbS